MPTKIRAALYRRFSGSAKEDKKTTAPKLKTELVMRPKIKEVKKSNKDDNGAKAGRSMQSTSQPAPLPTTPALPSLQGIPGELRNRIYRLALLEDGMIRVYDQNHEQPGLLLTSRQIRTEALSIYMTENTFKLDAWNMLLTVPKSYDAHWISQIPSKRLYITMRGTANWDNLREWWRRYCENKLPGLASGQPTPEAEILAQGFTLVDGLRGKITFKEMKTSLDAFIKALELSGKDFNFR